MAALILETRFSPPARIDLASGGVTDARGSRSAALDVALTILQPSVRLVDSPVGLELAPKGAPRGQWVLWATLAVAAVALVVVGVVRVVRR